MIRHARELGLTIEAIRQLIQLDAHPERRCDQADRIAEQQLKTVRVKSLSCYDWKKASKNLNRLQRGLDKRLLCNRRLATP